MTAYGQAQGINLAVCDINLAGANAGSDAILCDSAGDPPSDAYCAYTAEETVLSPFSMPPVDLVRGENFTISWHISGFVCSTLTQVQCQSAAATCKWIGATCQEYTSTSRGPSISNPATRRSFVMITQEDCPATLTGRRSFLQEQCETLATAQACNAAGAPCLWDAADGEPPFLLVLVLLMLLPLPLPLPLPISIYIHPPLHTTPTPQLNPKTCSLSHPSYSSSLSPSCSRSPPPVARPQAAAARWRSRRPPAAPAPPTTPCPS
eukprot:COSAG04_NODE_10016_length_811_cov_3.702665_1_plen_263_part_01